MRVYIFLAGMWVLLILGGGLAVMVLGPLDLGTGNSWLNSPFKALAACLMVLAWIILLVRFQRYVLR